MTTRKPIDIKGLSQLDKFIYFASSDVTGNLIFGKDYDVYIDFRNKKKHLSKGASEKKEPLPIVSKITQSFFEVFQEDPDAFIQENEPDQKVIPVVLKKAIHSLGFNTDYLEIWTNPFPVSNDQLILKNPSDKKISFPLTFEIMSLIMLALSSFSVPNTINQRFLNVLQKNYFGYQKYLQERKSPKFLMEQRIEDLIFKPVTAKSIDSEKAQYTFAVDAPFGILSLAWAEFYLSQVYEMPISICSYCGKAYRLTGKYEVAGSCGDANCKKLIKKDRDFIKRVEEPESVKEKDRKRQQRVRDKKKAKELAAKGQTVKEIMEAINKKAKERGDKSGIRTIDEIKNWINP